MLINPVTLLERKTELATLLEKTMRTKNEVQLMSGTRALYLLVDEIQQQLDSTHVKLSALLKEKEALLKENRRLKEWLQEKSSYVLHSLPAGTFVYRLRSLTERAAADYYLCVRCYQNHVKSILQPGIDNLLNCAVCDSSIQIRPGPKAKP